MEHGLRYRDVLHLTLADRIVDERTHGNSEKRYACLAKNSFAMAATKAVKEAVSPFGDHYDQICFCVICRIYDGLDHIAGTDIFVPVPTWNFRSVKGRHRAGVSDMKESKSSVIALQAFHKSRGRFYRRLRAR